MNAEIKTINIIGTDAEVDRGIWRHDSIVREPVDTDTLRDNLKDFSAKLDHVLGAIPTALGELSLDSITVSVEISAKGSVSLIGIGGAEVAGKGGISFTLKRSVSDGKKPADS